MISKEVVPRELRSLVTQALSPGVRWQRAGEDVVSGAWSFELSWAGQSFELLIAKEDWEENRRQLISLRAKLAAPAPEATRGGRRFWASFYERPATGEAFKYVFTLFWRPRGRVKFVSVPLTLRAHEVLAYHGSQTGHDSRAYPLAAALWYLKDRIDEEIEESTETINDIDVERFKFRQVAPDPDVRSYVEWRLYQAYQVAGKDFLLRFDWADLEYLGVSQADFIRAVSAREGKDWIINGLALSPTRDLREKFDLQLYEEIANLPRLSRVTAD